MDRTTRIAALRILLQVALEDAAQAASTWARGVALQDARTARAGLRELGAAA